MKEKETTKCCRHRKRKQRRLKRRTSESESDREVGKQGKKNKTLVDRSEDGLWIQRAGWKKEETRFGGKQVSIKN